MIPRRITAIAIAAMACALVSACGGGGISAQQGTTIADTTRHSAAVDFWQLDDSFGTAVYSTGGLGRFGACSTSAPDDLAYGITAAIGTQPKSTQNLAEFTSSVLQGFDKAGWSLPRTGDDAYLARRDGVTVSVRFFQDNNGPGGSLIVQSDCVNMGSAASGIANDYGGDQSDQYPQSDASARPIPTTFATPGG